MSIAVAAGRYEEPPPVSEATRQPAPGRLRHEGLSSKDRNFALWLHISPLIAVAIMWPLTPVIPLVIWLAHKDESSFVDDHGREVLNYLLSLLILTVLLSITIIGIPVAIVLVIMWIVNGIRGAIAAGNSEYFRYPMTFRFFS